MLGPTGARVFPVVIPMPLIERLREDVAYAWEVCREMQERNGVARDADMTIHHILGIRPSFVELIEAMRPLDNVFTDYFGGKYILNSMGGSAVTKDHTSYAGRVHRDVRSFAVQHTLLNTIVMLDDFTAENGATWLYPWIWENQPVDEVFDICAERAIGSAGSVLVFDSNVWHRSGINTTDSPRRAITPMFCLPWVKPQFDYPYVLGARDDLSDYQRQVIGYNARIPASLDEWYQPPATRFYRGDQG